MMITITLPDGTKKKYQKGITALAVAESIGKRLAKDAVAVVINGAAKDLTHKINSNSSLKILTFDSAEGKDVFWHSGAHLMAQAMLRLFPKAKLAIGPVWEGGFYYDVAHAPFTSENLEKIEQEMRKIVAEHLPVHRKVLTKSEAKKLFKNNKYKLEIIAQIEGKELSAYKQGEFIDLCEGPHVPNTSYLKSFKLTKTSGVYWRGDAKNDQLQRIYGVAFPSEKHLKAHLTMLAESEKKDHRKLGPKLGLFMFTEFSPGAPIFLPKGVIVYNELLRFMREEYRKRGYKEVITPLLYEKSLWEKSGHWDHFRENMFTLEIEGKLYALKPMNCPSHLLIYKQDHRSYRDLPMRIADFAPLHRNELSGTLTGLTRVRKLIQDDAHIFVAPGQISSEIEKLIDFVNFIYKDVFNFDYTVELSTKPEKALGDPKLWSQAEEALKKTLSKKNVRFTINEGQGAFYGPKIDFHIKDSLGRSWQCGTIQLDFNLPERFEAMYEGKDGKRHSVIMIHRALLGSMERFMGVLIEHYAGKFPMWLSPVQVRILTVADRFNQYAQKIAHRYAEQGIRVEVDERHESVSYKVREAELDKVNYILVVGDKEIKNHTVTVRTRENRILGAIEADVFLQRLLKEIADRN